MAPWYGSPSPSLLATSPASSLSAAWVRSITAEHKAEKDEKHSHRFHIIPTFIPALAGNPGRLTLESQQQLQEQRYQVLCLTEVYVQRDLMVAWCSGKQIFQRQSGKVPLLFFQEKKTTTITTNSHSKWLDWKKVGSQLCFRFFFFFFGLDCSSVLIRISVSRFSSHWWGLQFFRVERRIARSCLQETEFASCHSSATVRGIDTCWSLKHGHMPSTC